MKVDLNIEEGFCLVTKESGDPRFSGSLNAAGESRLLYHVKQHLNKLGFDFIKKRMHKDGHMVSELQQYLRSRTTPFVTIWFGNWAIEGADEVLNRDGKVSFEVERV